MDAAILAGGRGTRIPEVSKKVPKPMLRLFEPPFDKPLLQYNLEQLHNIGFEKFKIVVGYKKEVIEDWFSKKKFKIQYIQTKDGIGADIASLENVVGSEFLLLFGDMLIEEETITELLAEFKFREPIGIVLATILGESRSEIGAGFVNTETGEFGTVTSFSTKREKKTRFAPAAYVLNKKIFKYFKNGNEDKESLHFSAFNTAIANGEKFILYCIPRTMFVDDMADLKRLADYVAKKEGLKEKFRL